MFGRWFLVKITGRIRVEVLPGRRPQIHTQLGLFLCGDGFVKVLSGLCVSACGEKFGTNHSVRLAEFLSCQFRVAPGGLFYEMVFGCFFDEEMGDVGCPDIRYGLVENFCRNSLRLREAGYQCGLMPMESS